MLAAALAVGGFYVSTTHATHTITGSLVLDSGGGGGITSGAGICFGSGGYSDLKGGAPVTLKDETGTILGSTSLSFGSGTSRLCSFSFTIENVPDTAKFYVVSVSHRGDISESHDELQSDGWKFSLTIGG